jgi:hypothetical protein
MKQYYLVWYRLDGVDRYFIWYSQEDDKDRVVIDEARKVRAFLSIPEAVQYAEAQGWTFEYIDPLLNNLDMIESWLSTLDPERVDCKEFLGAWNLFNDVNYSVTNVDKKDFLPTWEYTDLVYEKLFYGNNLPAITPEGEHYTPTWPPHHIKELKRVFTAGLRMFRANVAEQNV